jgi:hypothetical protein
VSAPDTVEIEVELDRRAGGPLFEYVVRFRGSGKLLCRSVLPFYGACRALSEQGYPPSTRVEMWRPGMRHWDLAGHIGGAEWFPNKPELPFVP